MKNIVTVDIDNSRDKKILITKPFDTQLPETTEAALNMIINDIITLAHGLRHLVDVASTNEKIDRVNLIDAIIKTLNEK